MDNCHGNGFMGLKGIYVFSGLCPLHGEKANAPTLARAGEDTAITDPLRTARCQQ